MAQFYPPSFLPDMNPETLTFPVPPRSMPLEMALDAPSPLAKQQALSQHVRRNPALAMPTSGADPEASTGATAAPAPPAAPAAPAPRPVLDYRQQALKTLEEAGNVGPTEEERAEGNRKLVLALALGMKGGEGLQPASGHILKQALSDPEAA